MGRHSTDSRTTITHGLDSRSIDGHGSYSHRADTHNLDCRNTGAHSTASHGMESHGTYIHPKRKSHNRSVKRIDRHVGFSGSIIFN